MPRVVIELPPVLAGVLDGERELEVEVGETLDRAFRDIASGHPALGRHLFGESGDLREHVLCFLNDVNTRWLESPGVRLADGDRLTVMQAVSGG